MQFINNSLGSRSEQKERPSGLNVVIEDSLPVNCFNYMGPWCWRCGANHSQLARFSFFFPEKWKLNRASAISSKHVLYTFSAEKIHMEK